jgi:hypothetical protein
MYACSIRQDSRMTSNLPRGSLCRGRVRVSRTPLPSARVSGHEHHECLLRNPSTLIGPPCACACLDVVPYIMPYSPTQYILSPNCTLASLVFRCAEYRSDIRPPHIGGSSGIFLFKSTIFQLFKSFKIRNFKKIEKNSEEGSGQLCGEVSTRHNVSS